MSSLIRLSSLAAVCVLLSNTVAYAQCQPDIPASTPSERFEVPGDGTVRDKQTGLIWKRCLQGLSGADCSQGSVFSGSWEQALQQAEANPGWRMPNIKELHSIVEEQCYNPAINTQIFPGQNASLVWSSSPDASYTKFAWIVNFYDGGTSTGHPYRTNALRVRLVRSGQ